MTTVRRVNLLPREIEQQRRSRQKAVAVVLAAIGVVAILVGAYLFQLVRLHSEQNKLAAQTKANTELRAELATLKDFDTLQQQLKAKADLVSTLTQDEVRWSRVLGDVSMVIPRDAWLIGFTGTVAPSQIGGTKSTKPGETVVLGQIQMNGVTFTHVDVAVWLTRLSEVEGFTLPYLSLSSKTKIDDVEVVDFNSSVNLSDKAFRANQPGAQRKV